MTGVENSACKKRKTPYNPKHQLLYGQTISSRSNSIVEEVRCNFCFHFGVEVQNEANRKRRATQKVKYFHCPFRVDNFKSHLLHQHPTRWKQYNSLCEEDKHTYFNSTPLRPLPQRNEIRFQIDHLIIEKLICKLMLPETDEPKRNSILSLFSKCPDSNSYVITIKNKSCFEKCLQYIACGSSVSLTTRLLQCSFRDVNNDGDLITKEKVAFYYRVVVAVSLQKLSEMLRSNWAYSIVFTESTHQNIFYLDIQVRFYNAGRIHNFHVLALPGFDRCSGEFLFDATSKVFEILDPMWRKKVVGIISSGVQHMTPVRKELISYIQEVALPGFYRIWCILSQFDLLIQTCVVEYFKDDLYCQLVELTQYLRRQPDLNYFCPLLTNAHWLNLYKVTSWYAQKGTMVQRFLDIQKPVCTPSKIWWVYVGVVQSICYEINSCFERLHKFIGVRSQQDKYLNDLKRNLVSIAGIENADQIGEPSIMQQSVSHMIKDLGASCRDIFNSLSGANKATVHQDIAKFIQGVLNGINKLQHVLNACDYDNVEQLPPVLPHQLVHIRTHEFVKIVEIQSERFKARKGLDLLHDIEEDHRELLRAYRNEDSFASVLNKRKDTVDFKHAWSATQERFNSLKEFCGGLATVYPSYIPTEESEAPAVNNMKNSQSLQLIDLSLEGILHSKHFTKLSTLSYEVNIKEHIVLTV